MSAGLLALLAGRDVRWSALQMTPAQFLDACARDDVKGLMHARIERLPDRAEWPAEIQQGLAAYVHRETAREMLRAEEISTALVQLAAAGVDAVLIKGAALAHSVYDAPAHRPRADTDILLRERDVAAARGVFARCGYVATVHCSDLFSQFEVQKEDRFGVRHVFDVHWKISTQPLFERLLSYEELRETRLPVPALGPAAYMPSIAHSLLLACVHPVMHHQNSERLLWVYDVARLVARLKPGELRAAADAAEVKQVAAIMGRALQRARETVAVDVPDDVIARLAGRRDEPSAIYLQPGRHWRHELASSLRTLPGWRARLAHLRKVLFPERDYMRRLYGLDGKPLGPWLLPALYVHRNMRGVWKILTGKK